MSNEDRGAIPRPIWRSSDEYAGPKRLAWGILVDAIMKSILSNDIQSDRVVISPESLIGLVESREWLTTEEETADITRSMCCTMLDIGEVSLFESLRHLWLRREEKMTSHMRNKLGAVREAIMQEKQAVRIKRKYKLGGEFAGKNDRMVMLLRRAMASMSETNALIGAR